MAAGSEWMSDREDAAPQEPAPQDPAREDVAKRLARIAGHAASLKRFWDEDRECVEMLTQISAVRAALDQVGKTILEQHVDHAMRDALDRGSADDAARDLKKAIDRLI